MAEDLVNLSEVFSPFLSYLREMEQELKCGHCSILLSNPKVLPCDHIFCSHCIALSSTPYGYWCMTCRTPFLAGDPKPAMIIPKMVSIFEGMDAAVGSIFLKNGSQLHISDSGNMGVTELPTSATKKNLGIARDGVSIKQELNCHDQPVCCNMDSDKDNNCQVNEPGKNYFPPILSSNVGFVETNAITEVDMLEPATHSAGGVPDTVLSHRTINRKSTLERLEENSQESKRQKLIECAFCGTFRISEGSGPMQHYLEGKQVTEKEANQAKVIHVHQKCINWAPLVYFKDETAINLEKEISRASKLKCSKCGQKGAALGCYYDHCTKTFHVPCAYETPGCRWDCVELNVLCPSHISKKLPCDKYGNGEMSEAKDFPVAQIDCSDALSTQLDCLGLLTTSPCAASGMMLCGSALSSTEYELMENFANLIGASVSDEWEENVTHVIASADDNGACFRTFKTLMAILNGKWLLKISWIKDCIEVQYPVPEGPYEFCLDNHGFVDGPKKGRLRAMEKAPKIFTGLKFYFVGQFPTNIKSFIDQLVIAAGGTILNRKAFLSLRGCIFNRNDFVSRLNLAQGSSLTSYVVYNGDAPENSGSLFAEHIRLRAEEAKALAAETGARVISYTWIFDAVSASSVEF